MEMKFPKLNKDDYLKKDYEFWKNYRITLTKIIQEQQKEQLLDKTPENIYKKAKEIGVKPTARYFNIQPSQARYYIKKIENEKNNIIDFCIKKQDYC